MAEEKNQPEVEEKSYERFKISTKFIEARQGEFGEFARIRIPNGVKIGSYDVGGCTMSRPLPDWLRGAMMDGGTVTIGIDPDKPLNLYNPKTKETLTLDTPERVKSLCIGINKERQAYIEKMKAEGEPEAEKEGPAPEASDFEQAAAALAGDVTAPAAPAPAQETAQ